MSAYSAWREIGDVNTSEDELATGAFTRLPRGGKPMKPARRAAGIE
jgi:hypothetical protein